MDNDSYFDFKVARLPNISDNYGKLKELTFTFEDIFLIPIMFNDNYDRKIVEEFDNYLFEGAYGITDGDFDVTVKSGDIVIDAGAWLGDFAAYAANKGAVVYAFEPVKDTYGWLCKTAEMNNPNNFHPIECGLSDSFGKVDIAIDATNSGGNSIVMKDVKDVLETIQITTLDKFVKDNNIERVDFIKADIEGAERNMLRGAKEVLKKFAPKLAICTYHLPDDPDVLEQIIKDTNPNYTVVHLSKKLLAAVVKTQKTESV